ncbi:hypothetical protein [Kitasatospora aureofaciens]|uniref:hypothetical protein n=1 Tax=Kitasatospora aureofaciens TaxID=1894 RepID=UPI0036F465EA
MSSHSCKQTLNRLPDGTSVLECFAAAFRIRRKFGSGYAPAAGWWFFYASGEAVRADRGRPTAAPLDPGIPGYGVTVLDRAGSASALMPPLGEDQKRTVPVRVQPDKEGGFVTVEVTPSSAGYRETAYWQLDLD